MAYLPIILFLLSLWRYLPPILMTQNFSISDGLFPNYGFEQSDSVRFIPILHLVQTGAYSVEEEGISYHKGKQYSGTHSYKLFRKNDSVIIEEYNIGKDKLSYLSEKKIYSLSGKLIYSLSMLPDGRKNHLSYFKSKDSMVAYYTTAWSQDSLSLLKIDIYNNDGRIIEIVEPDLGGEVIQKEVFQYDNNGNKISDMKYYQKPDSQELAAEKIMWSDLGDSNYEKKWLQYKKVHEELQKNKKIEFKLIYGSTYKIDTTSRTIETSHYSGAKDTVPDRYIISYDHKWREIGEYDILSDGRKKIDEETRYVDDKNGRLLSKIVYRKRKVSKSDYWKYDNKGRCIQHIDGKENKTWKYDSKGNIIESVEKRGGELRDIQRFRISYQ